jgi:hypothetical protein
MNGNGPYLIHYLPARGGPLPDCVRGRGGITPDTGAVNCPRCRASLRFRIDDLRRAYVALLRAVFRRGLWLI